MKRIISLFILTALIAVFLIGCSGEEKAQADKDGNMLAMTFEQIYEEGRQGIFVMNKDGTYSPVLESVPGYQGPTGSASPTRYLWYVDSEENNYTNLIPIATPETPLVCIYRSNAALPSNWYLEEYTDKGYSVGAHFYVNGSNEMYMETETSLDGTSASSVIASSPTPDSEYSILSVNDGETLPIKNIDPNMKLFLGLEKNKVYNFSYYTGTIPRKISMYADMRVFQSSSYATLTAPVKKTPNGYFIVNLPANLKSGYYYICDIGLFEYRGKE